MTLPRPAGGLVIDASVAVAIAAREANRDASANSVLRAFSENSYCFYAPGAIITEVLYALCQKHQRAVLTDAEYDLAVTEFEILMRNVLPPPLGDSALIKGIHDLGKGYGCSRSADGAYITLAEQLTRIMPTELVTFDRELPKQAARNAPTVNVRLL